MNQAMIDSALDWEYNLGAGNNFLTGDPFASDLQDLSIGSNSGNSILGSSISSIVNSTTGKIVIVGLLTLFFLKVIGEKG